MASPVRFTSSVASGSCRAHSSPRLPTTLRCGLAIALLALALAACDDPSDVGGGLVGPQGATPQRVELPIAAEPARYDVVTGQQSRVLAGQTTSDPLGDVSATGYLDFTIETPPPDEAEARSAELELVPDYTYGDTSQATRFALRDIEEEWNAVGATADTSLSEIAEDTPITEFTVAPGDTAVIVALPDRWLNEHRTALEEDSSFADEFHGFQIAPVSGRSVLGFDGQQTMLRVVLGDLDADSQKTASYLPSEQLTTLRQPNAARPQDRFVLQEGTGRALNFRLRLPDSLADVSVNRAVLRFDPAPSEPPMGFARPVADSLRLFASSKGDTVFNPYPRRLGGRTVPFDLPLDQGRFQGELTQEVQRALLDRATVDRFQLRPLEPSLTLNAVLFYMDEQRSPRLVVTYTAPTR